MRIRRRLGALPACLVLAIPLAIPASADISPLAVSCSVDYAANNWGGGGGFGAKVIVNNFGDPVPTWTLTFTFPGNQRVTQGWNATWSQPQGSANVTATSMPYNGLATGASTEIGFNGTYSGTNSNPTNFAINGVACTGANQGPTVSLTQPATGTNYTAGANVPLAATAADGDGSIARVEFYAGDTLIGSDESSPFTTTWNNAPAGNHVLVARAYDNTGAFTNSAPIDVTVSPNAGPSVVATPVAVSVPEGGSTADRERRGHHHPHHR
jgi:hypothetical protein